MSKTDKQPTELTGKDLAFALAYIELGPVRGRTTQAAIKAGFSKTSAATMGSRLLKKVEVSTYVRTREQEIVKKIEEKQLVNKQWVIEQLKEVYKQSMRGEPHMVWEDGKMVPSGEWMFDSRGANRALELLGKTIGMFSEKKPENPNDTFNLTINLGADEQKKALTIDYAPSPQPTDTPTINLEG